MNWINLQSKDVVDQIINIESTSKTCIIFKHSTTCSISGMAHYRLSDDWDAKLDETSFYYLDLLAYRDVSNYIAEKLQVHHESPQVIIIKNGEAVYDVSHLDIEVSDILTEV